MPLAFPPQPGQQAPALPTPWAASGPLGKQQSHAHAVLERGAARGGQFHHYYKKHMTMLGLQRALDSSDSDSETDSNFQTKLFRRRHHPLKQHRTMRDVEAEALAARKAATPWEYHPNTLDAIGIDVAQERRDADNGGPPQRSGKRVAAFGVMNARLDEPRPKRLTPALKHAENVADPRTRTSFRGPWEQRQAEEEEQKRWRRQHVRPKLEMFSPAPHAVGHTPAPELPPRSKSSMSKATALKVVRTIKELRADHAESMRRHERIMKACTPTL